MRIQTLFIILSGIILMSCQSNSKKINGVSFVSSRVAIDESHVNPVLDVHANYAAIMPFGFIKDLDQPNLVFNTKRQWFGERVEGVRQYAEVFKKQGIGLMLKPQIWVWHGQFTGLINMKNETDWNTFEKAYSEFILTYADLAEALEIPLFCIGTELKIFTTQRPQFWNELISKIKKRYHGKLTYAANWNEYEYVSFWKQLDYIGIDAYFPINENKTPVVADCLKAWSKYKPQMKQMSEQYDSPILFTEFGYRSVDYSGKAPWVSDRNMKGVNLDAQYNTTKALFDACWTEDWFAGGFVWKWFHNHDEVGGKTNTMFTPQNKPVQALIKSQYQSK